jgi:hypothetical protein
MTTALLSTKLWLKSLYRLENMFKKVFVTFAFISVHTFCFSQNLSVKYLFNFEILKRFATHISGNDTIIPVYNSGKFHFINSVTKQEVSSKTFDEAYPFENNWALVKKDGKYGVVNKDISYEVKPTFTNPDIRLNNSGNEATGYEDTIKKFTYEYGKFIIVDKNYVEGKPVGPQIYFRKEGRKYFFELSQKQDKKGRQVRSAAIYDSSYVFNPSFALVKKSGKIGAINYLGETVIPLTYEEWSVPNSFTWQHSLFALKKKGQWHYFQWGYLESLKELFQNNVQPDMTYSKLFMFKVGELYNYFDEQGIKALPREYKWINQNGTLAIGPNDEVVLFNNKKEEFIYY